MEDVSEVLVSRVFRNFMVRVLDIHSAKCFTYPDCMFEYLKNVRTEEINEIGRAWRAVALLAQTNRQYRRLMQDEYYCVCKYISFSLMTSDLPTLYWPVTHTVADLFRHVHGTECESMFIEDSNEGLMQRDLRCRKPKLIRDGVWARIIFR